jgi:hypothetical protein
MRYTKKRTALLLSLLMPLTLFAKGLPVLFLGVVGNSEPDYDAKLHDELTSRLSTIPGIELIAQQETRRIIDRAFAAHGAPKSEHDLRTLGSYVQDTAAVVWIHKTHSAITPRRAHWFGTALHAHSGLNLAVYSLHDSTFVYYNEINRTHTFSHKWLWLDRLEKLHIGAVTETKLHRAMQDSLLDAAVDTIALLCATGMSGNRSLTSPRGDGGEKTDISDVFSVPSVGGRNLYEETPGQDTTAADTSTSQ